jgi:hypothetical protein
MEQHQVLARAARVEPGEVAPIVADGERSRAGHHRIASPKTTNCLATGLPAYQHCQLNLDGRHSTATGWSDRSLLPGQELRGSRSRRCTRRQ